MNDIKNIIHKIYNTFIRYNNNYYNCININNILLSLSKNDFIKNNIMKKTLNEKFDTFDTLLIKLNKEKNEKQKREEKINSKINKIKEEKENELKNMKVKYNKELTKLKKI